MHLFLVVKDGKTVQHTSDPEEVETALDAMTGTTREQRKQQQAALLARHQREAALQEARDLGFHRGFQVGIAIGTTLAGGLSWLVWWSLR